ncbi:MAG: hypothetical protein K8F25_02450 [Fimbriimonadaceae bacterium]|nr:hypothetical protein [Alphaproteobacteria bacterium]
MLPFFAVKDFSRNLFPRAVSVFTMGRTGFFREEAGAGVGVHQSIFMGHLAVKVDF